MYKTRVLYLSHLTVMILTATHSISTKVVVLCMSNALTSSPILCDSVPYLSVTEVLRLDQIVPHQCRASLAPKLDKPIQS